MEIYTIEKSCAGRKKDEKNRKDIIIFAFISHRLRFHIIQQK